MRCVTSTYWVGQLAWAECLRSLKHHPHNCRIKSQQKKCKQLPKLVCGRPQPSANCFEQFNCPLFFEPLPFDLIILHDFRPQKLPCGIEVNQRSINFLPAVLTVLCALSHPMRTKGERWEYPGYHGNGRIDFADVDWLICADQSALISHKAAVIIIKSLRARLQSLLIQISDPIKMAICLVSCALFKTREHLIGLLCLVFFKVWVRDRKPLFSPERPQQAVTKTQNQESLNFSEFCFWKKNGCQSHAKVTASVWWHKYFKVCAHAKVLGLAHTGSAARLGRKWSSGAFLTGSHFLRVH